MILIVNLTVILFINGCSSKVFYAHDCPTFDSMEKIERIKLYTDANGQFTVRSSYDANLMLENHRVKEHYNDTEIIRLKEKVKELKDENK